MNRPIFMCECDLLSLVRGYRYYYGARVALASRSMNLHHHQILLQRYAVLCLHLLEFRVIRGHNEIDTIPRG